MGRKRRRWVYDAQEVGGDGSLELDHLLGLVVGKGQVDLLRTVEGSALWLSVRDAGGEILSEIVDGESWSRLAERLVGAGGLIPADAVTIAVGEGTTVRRDDTHWIVGSTFATPGPVEFFDLTGRFVHSFPIGS